MNRLFTSMPFNSTLSLSLSLLSLYFKDCVFLLGGSSEACAFSNLVFSVYHILYCGRGEIVIIKVYIYYNLPMRFISYVIKINSLLLSIEKERA